MSVYPGQPPAEAEEEHPAPMQDTWWGALDWVRQRPLIWNPRAMNTGLRVSSRLGFHVRLHLQRVSLLKQM